MGVGAGGLCTGTTGAADFADGADAFIWVICATCGSSVVAKA
jgi:hypothetical protein